MQFHERIRSAITQNHQKIELFQWATISSITGLFFSEYIRRMEKRSFPSPRVDVPTIHQVRELLNPSGMFADKLSHGFIDGMVEHPLMQTYGRLPEFILFNEDNREVLKCILDAYIIPNIGPTVANVIINKFGLQDEKQQGVYQNRELDMFEGAPLAEEHLAYLVDETVLNLILTIPSLGREVRNPPDLSNIDLESDTIITIANKNAANPIHLDRTMIDRGGKILDLIKFVSSTTFDVDARSNGDPILMSNAWFCSASSSPYNEVTLTKIIGENVMPSGLEG